MTDAGLATPDLMDEGRDSDEVRLERFVLDNPDLERLESVLGDFNPFVAMGWTRQEVRHSRFLRWLLDPNETHGIGNYFLRTFVKRVATRAVGRSGVPSVVDADGWPFSNTQVLSEWKGIDVFVRDDALRFVAIIENKLDSGEHSQQLTRYRELVEAQFGGFEKLFVLLTVEGDAPSDEAYISLSYADVCQLVAEVLERRSDQLGPEVRSFLSHYVEMLRREIVEDSQIQVLCRTIYQTHRQALDLIFEYRPDRTLELSEFLQQRIGDRDDLRLDQSSKAHVRFWPLNLDFLPKSGAGWTRTGRMMLFEIDLSASDVRIKAVLGPGPQEVRERVHDWIRAHPDAFNRGATKLYPQWWSFHSEQWLTKGRFEGNEVDELKDRVWQRLEQFIQKELPAMEAALAGLAQVVASANTGQQQLSN